MSVQAGPAPGHSLSPACLRWDERYQSQVEFFGTAPSPFLVDTLASHGPPKPDARRALCLGEGEGRDAIFLARAGFEVTAVDGSKVGLERLQTRARQLDLEVERVHADLAHYVIEARRYALVASFYCHLPPDLRRQVFAAAARALVPGGILLLEGFSPRQRAEGLASGGPRDPQLLFALEQLRTDVEPFVEIDEAFEGRTELDFGRHRGPAFITRLRGRAPLPGEDPHAR